MNARNTVIGTTKRLIAEVIGDGVLAEEGSRQSVGELPSPTLSDGETTVSQEPTSGAVAAAALSSTPALTEHERFALLLGHAALSLWPDLPREAQERLFAAAADDSIIANSLAIYLHDRHPRTHHPSKPTLIA